MFFGRLSLIAVLLAMVSFDYQITLKSVYGAPAFLADIAAAFAATGLFSQALLGLTHAKDRWLAARFAAERLRCFKFQLFTVLEEVPDAHSLAARVKQRTSEGLAALEQEMMGGRVRDPGIFALRCAVAAQEEAGACRRKAAGGGGRGRTTSCAFRVESQHFEDRFRDHDQETKFPSLLSEFSFMSGAVLACIGILTALLPPGMAPVADPDRAGDDANGWIS